MDKITYNQMNFRVVLQYVYNMNKLEATASEIVKASIDIDSVKMLMGTLRASRTAYMAFCGTVAVGYVIHDHDAYNLDMLHVHPEYRDRGIAQKLVRLTSAKTVSVDSSNYKAIHIYSKLGLELDLN